MFGKIELENFTGLTSMPQRAASAWDSVMKDLDGVNYKPLLFCGTQIVRGVNYFFIAELDVAYAQIERRIVLLAINEFQGKYELINSSIEVIL